MDTRKKDADVKTAPEAPARPAPGEPGPGPRAVPSEPLHGPVEVAEDSLDGLQTAFRALTVEEVVTQPVKRKREREKDAGDEADEEQGLDQRQFLSPARNRELSKYVKEFGCPRRQLLKATPAPTGVISHRPHFSVWSDQSQNLMTGRAPPSYRTLTSQTRFNSWRNTLTLLLLR